MIWNKIRENNATDWINYVAIAYAFTVSTSRAGIVFFTMLLIILWLVEGDFKKKYEQIVANKVTLLFGGLIVFSFLSILWSSYQLNGLVYVIKYWYYIVIVVFMTSLKKEYIEYGISAFLAGVFISELLSYGIFFELIEWKNKLPNFPTPFMNHLQYSLFLAFTSLLLLNRIFSETDIKVKYFYFFYFLTVTINLFVNGGRTGQVAFIVTLFIVGFLNIKNKIKAFLSMLFLAFAILYIGYGISPNFKERVDCGVEDALHIIKDSDFCGSFGRRVGAWIVATELIYENPLIGTGVGSEMPTLRESIRENHPDKVCMIGIANFHNDFVHIFVQLGLIGGMLYLLLFYNLLKLKITNRLDKKIVITFVLVYFISSMFENMFHQQFSMALLALFAGIFMAQKRIEEEPNNIKN